MTTDAKRKEIFYICAAVMLFLIFFNVTKVHAATGYKYLQLSSQKTVKSGDYYLSCESPGGRTVISEKRNGRFQPTPMSERICANGKQAYYLIWDNDEKTQLLCRYVFRSGKETVAASLPAVDESWWEIHAVYGGKVFLQEQSDYSRDSVYAYDLKKDKLSKVKSGCSMGNAYGRYIIAESHWHGDTSAHPVTLYKITGSKLKKVKQLTKYGCSSMSDYAKFIGEKIYYISFSEADMGISQKITLYRCNANGSGKEKLGTFQNATISGEDSITSTKCRIWIGGNEYEYSYASKKLKICS